MSTMIEGALALANKGIAVFPCLPKSKEPATSHGAKDATTNINAIENWWHRYPHSNVAAATGRVSGRLFVVDIDGLDAEEELRRLEAKHTVLPPTTETITARGRHLWFRSPAGCVVKNTASVIAPKIDTRGEGGYILTPPSTHPSGRRYEWSVDSADVIATSPDWLIEKIAARVNGAGIAVTPPTEWRELITAGVAEGARDNTIARLAGYLLRRRNDPYVVLELLQSWNLTRCLPPLPASDIERIVASIADRELQRRKQTNA